MQAIIFRLKIFLSVFLVIMILGTIGFVFIDKKTVVEAEYFVIVTVATVVYGDIHPATQLGRIFTIFLIVTGVGTFLGVVANLTELMLAKRKIESLMKKLNMFIGVFFSEVGLQLMLLINEWLDYMKYLKANYPFLFHLAMRTNPFDRSASITVK